jgi:Putative restriction endonuclease
VHVPQSSTPHASNVPSLCRDIARTPLAQTKNHRPWPPNNRYAWPITASIAPLKAMSATEYFAWEEAQTSRHDFYLGKVFAMAGASDAHNTTALNIAAALKAHLRGGPCRVYMSDMRLELVPGDHYVYPDVMVVCDPRNMIPESSHLKSIQSSS